MLKIRLSIMLATCCLLFSQINAGAQDGYDFKLRVEDDGFKWYEGYYNINDYAYRGAFNMNKKLITPRDEVRFIFYDNGYFTVESFSGKGLYSKTGKCIISLKKGFWWIGVYPHHGTIWAQKQKRSGSSDRTRAYIEKTYNLQGKFLGYGHIDVDEFRENRQLCAFEQYSESIVEAAQEIVWNKKPLDEVIPLITHNAEKEGYILRDMKLMEYDDDISWYVCSFEKEHGGGNYSALANMAGMLITPVLPNASYKHYDSDDNRFIIYVMSDGQLAVYNILGKPIIPFEDGVAEVVLASEGHMIVKNKDGYYRLYDYYKGKCVLGMKWGDYDFISFEGNDLLWCRSGDIRTTHSLSGRKIAQRWMDKGEIDAALAEQQRLRSQKLEALASALTAMSDALNQTSVGSQVYSNPSNSTTPSSSGAAVYSRGYKDHGYHSALKIWQSFGNTVYQSESVQITEDNQGSLYMKIGGNYSLVTPNSLKTFMGVSVATYNYSAIYNGVHYFISIR